MVQSGNYLFPTFRGDLRPDKPILIYWLMSLPLRLFGPTELACRFFASVGAALACLLTYFLACHLSGPGAGLLSMMILSTTPLLLMTGTAATTDAVLLMTILGAMTVFHDALKKGPTVMHGIGWMLFLGAALLTKGPVGLVLPILAMIAVLLLARRFSFPWAGYLFASSLLAVALFLVWAIPANDATGGEFLRRGIGYHVVERTARPLESHGGQFLLFLPFYLPVVIFAFFPWTLFLPGAFSAVAGGRIGGRDGRSFLLGWMIPVFLVMTFVSTKLPHYILPMWPALSLAVAGAIEAAERKALSPRDLKWFVYGRWLFVAIGVVGGAALVLCPWFIPPLGLSTPGVSPGRPGLAWPISGMGALLIVMTLLAAREHSAGRYRSTAGMLVAGTVCLLLIVSMIGLPMIERFKLSKPLADAIRTKTSPEVEVYCLDYDEPSLVFYLGSRHLKSVRGRAGVATWSKQQAPGVLVISKEALARIESSQGPLGLKEIAAARGFNYSKGGWVNIVALGRNLP
jgi:4-amino-4-deoxy-L-arabinose transferase-like glycosyltransferase